MPEYIEREALKERFRKRIKWLEKDVHDQYSLGLLHGCEYDVDLINEPPAAEVAPVVHGRWVAKPTMYRHPNARNYYCSECRYEPTETKEFCPLCGARMDGEGK